MLRQGAPPAGQDPFAAADRAQAADKQSHLAQLYRPPANAWDYHIPSPPSDIKVTAEGRAADVAVTQMLHAEGVPLNLGDAIMADLNRGRQSQKSLETTAALRPWAERMFRTARADPRIAAFLEDISADLFVATLSPELAAALVPFVPFARSSAGRR